MRFILITLLLGLLCRMDAQAYSAIEGKVFPYQDPILFNGESHVLCDFEGENVILELFSSTCVVCFRMMPEVNALQKEFEGRVKFLLVGYQDDKIEPLYARFQQQLGLTISAGFSQQLFQRFQPEAFPCYVWIRKDGNVAAVTYGDEELTRTNIASFVNTGDLLVKEQKTILDFDYTKPLFAGTQDYLVYTALSRWKPNDPYFMMLDLGYYPGTKHFNALGISLDRLYKYAIWGRSHWEAGHRFYGKKWPSVVIEGDEPNPHKDESFSFTAAYSGDKPPDLQQLLRTELDNYFHYGVSIETRLMPCYTVTLSQPGLFRSMDSTGISDMNHAGFTLQHSSFKNIISYLDYYSRDTLPFIDETGIDYPIDLRLEALLTDEHLFFQGLREKGILVTKRKRPMEVIVLRPMPK